MALFNQLYQFKGKHAEMVRKTVHKLGGNTVCRNIDVFFISIVLGLSHNRRADVDTNTSVEPAKIDPEQMVRFNDQVEYFYRLVMLSDKKYCFDAKERGDKAFRYNPESEECKKDEIHFTRVVLGGLEVLYEYIIDKTLYEEDIFNNIKDFIENYTSTTTDISEDDLRQII